MFIISAFKNLFTVIVVLLFIGVAMLGMGLVASGQIMPGLVAFIFGFIFVVMMFGICGIFIDMHDQMLKMNNSLGQMLPKSTEDMGVSGAKLQESKESTNSTIGISRP
jgi:hypothetical protein